MTDQQAGASDQPADPGTGIALDVEDDGRVGIFDAHHPPSDDRIADCVHCGFCLPTCPTYVLWGEEMDSPRGRIYLMKVGREGRVELDDTYVQHFDACLGCMACVTACPSGVAYDELIEATRPQLERNYTRTPADRAFRQLIYSVFPYHRRVRAASAGGWLYTTLGLRALLHGSGLAGRLPARLRALESLMPPTRLRELASALPPVTPASGTRRRRVGMVAGCIQQVYFSRVNDATARVLAAEGCEVVTPRGQGCCGALMLHSGQEPDALDKAKDLIATFEAEDVDTIVINAAGCGSSMKEYGRLLADDPEWAERAKAFSDKVRDVTELLAELDPVAPRHPIQAKAAYHDACHLAHAQGVTAQPRKILKAIPGLELADIPEGEICCGSAGIYNLVEPEPAEELGKRKAANIASVEPDLIATANPGCILQIRRHLDADIPLVHPVELVDASIRGTGVPAQRTASRWPALAALAIGAAGVAAVARRRSA
jgi:glycolate oxidase iron-sulfur subunit